MKKVLAVCTFALVFATPLVSSASSITNSFLTSSTGTAQIDISDTIQFEVTITLNASQGYQAVLWTLSGDIQGALPDSNAADHSVTNWDWHYVKANGAAGGSKYNIGFGLDNRLTPVATDGTAAPPGTSTPVSALWGYLGNAQVADGNPAMIGTVTIHADTNGVYQAGGYIQPGVGLFSDGVTPDTVTISGGNFTVGVVPEPGTALLLLLGLTGLGAMGRTSRRK
jgi:hypothetical protein